MTTTERAECAWAKPRWASCKPRSGRQVIRPGDDGLRRGTGGLERQPRQASGADHPLRRHRRRDQGGGVRPQPGPAARGPRRRAQHRRVLHRRRRGRPRPVADEGRHGRPGAHAAPSRRAALPGRTSTTRRRRFGLAVDRRAGLHAPALGGFTLGGGIGWLLRKHGLACDNLVGADVVTADGRLVHASADENPDLFWALRGGGGNFGVVTSLEFALHPVGPDRPRRAGLLPGRARRQVLTGWRELTHVDARRADHRWST